MWGWQKISTFCIFTFWAPSSRIPLTFRIKMIPNAGIIYLYFCLLLDVGLGFLHCTDNSPKISVTPIRWSVCVCVCMGVGLFYLTFSSSSAVVFVYSVSLVWLCCNCMDCSLPGSSVHGIFQAIILARVAISFSRRSSRSRDWTHISSITCRFFTTEPPRTVFSRELIQIIWIT